jgi:hypothetical protein
MPLVISFVEGVLGKEHPNRMLKCSLPIPFHQAMRNLLVDGDGQVAPGLG